MARGTPRLRGGRGAEECGPTALTSSYVYAGGLGATSEGSDQVSGTPGLHKEAALASWSPNKYFLPVRG